MSASVWAHVRTNERCRNEPSHRRGCLESSSQPFGLLSASTCPILSHSALLVPAGLIQPPNLVFARSSPHNPLGREPRCADVVSATYATHTIGNKAGRGQSLFACELLEQASQQPGRGALMNRMRFLGFPMPDLREPQGTVLDV